MSQFRLKGVEQLDARSLKSCLATRERPHFSLNIGRSYDPECGEPPFDAARLHLKLWRWPWADFPLYDRALFERDLERIDRWYRARGFYDARVVSTTFDPPAAATSDQLPTEEDEELPCERRGDDQGCTVDIEVTVEEGEPVLVEEVLIEGAQQLPAPLQRRLQNAVELRPQDRFDEARYDLSKENIADEMREASYACAKVGGRVEVDPEQRTASIRMRVEPGVPARLGELRVVGNEDLPQRPILGAAYLDAGDPYSESALDDAQRAIYALGAFSSVQVDPVIPEAGCSEPIPVRIRVSPGRRFNFRLGAGIQSGSPQNTAAPDAREWDIHGVIGFEHRNVFGGMRRLRAELRPRIIFPVIFPQLTEPRYGAQALLLFRQPAFLEPRTTLVTQSRWDWGPDPFGARFFRHDLDASVNLQRSFLEGVVFVSGGLHGNLFFVTEEDQPDLLDGTRDYHLLFWEQYVQLDLRDDPRRPRRGAFFSIELHEAGFGLPASWDYIRTTPEARGYVPLPLGMVLAFRFGIGAIFIFDAEEQLTTRSEELGPERYRLRGGGASSNRGFVPGDLGAGIEGGRRRWESSLELRMPLTESFGLVFFGDAGDVSRTSTFRFDHPQPAVGGGLRYQTVVGPLRLDIGYRIPGIQVIDGPDPRPRFQVNLGFVKFTGAVHLTIGEAF